MWWIWLNCGQWWHKSFLFRSWRIVGCKRSLVLFPRCIDDCKVVHYTKQLGQRVHFYDQLQGLWGCVKHRAGVCYQFFQLLCGSSSDSAHTHKENSTLHFKFIEYPQNLAQTCTYSKNKNFCTTPFEKTLKDTFLIQPPGKQQILQISSVIEFKSEEASVQIFV